MNALHQQLTECLQGRVCLVGLGEVERGDDGFGVRLAEAVLRSREGECSTVKPGAVSHDFTRLSPSNGKPSDSAGGRGGERRSSPCVNVLVAGRTPELWVGRLAAAAFDNVIFLDAVEIGAEAGSVVLLTAAEMKARFPQVSTHRLALGLLAHVLEGNANTKVWLIGVQPQSLRWGGRLTSHVQAAITTLATMLGEGSRRTGAEKGSPTESSTAMEEAPC
jgi:hydrogenase maturation protease